MAALLKTAGSIAMSDKVAAVLLTTAGGLAIADFVFGRKAVRGRARAAATGPGGRRTEAVEEDVGSVQTLRGNFCNRLHV